MHSFSAELARLVEERMSGGDYPSADALLIDALHALNELESRHAELQASLAARREKAEKGLGVPLDLGRFLQATRDR